MPLWQHLDDAADVAGLLWDSWVSDSTRDLVSSPFPEGEQDGRRFVRWIAGVHDVGKASPSFASQVPRLADAMRRGGFAFEYEGRIKGHRHEEVGASALGVWLRRHGWDGFSTGQITCIVMAHHGLFKRVPGRLGHSIVDVGDSEWAETRAALLDRMADRSGVTDRISSWRDVCLPGPVQMVVSGIVVMADWIASSDIFPLVDIDDLPQLASYTSHRTLRTQSAFAKVNLGGVWRPSPPPDPTELIQHRFPAIAQPRAVQVELVRAANDSEGTGLLILEAPMGIGKTEAALAAAEALALRFGCRGVLVALPTRATSDAMFTRVHDWLAHIPAKDASGTLPLALVHGKAALNEEYQDLRFGTAKHEAIYDGEKAAGVGVAEWMSGRKRAALSSFTVTTIDHVLMAALKAKHLMLRQLSLTGKVVILDEVHAADPFMSIYLTRALEWMAAMGVPVILMTATLPDKMRSELYAAYQSGVDKRDGRVAGVVEELSDELGYPAIITSRRSGPAVINPPSDHRQQKVQIRRLDDSPMALVEVLNDRLREGGCAVVIRNTVSRAQETAATLAQEFGHENVTLTHSCFLAIDRARKDLDLLARFGPPGRASDRPYLHIVVGTQVVEQSLDVDFDFMITDVAPVDLVMQRLGRLHRHRRERPAPLVNPECFVTGVEWSTASPQIDPGCRAVYRRQRLLACLAVLQQHLDGQPLSIPADIPRLVHDAYSYDLIPPPSWDLDWELARKEELEHVADQQDKARTFCLPAVMKHGRSLEGLTSGNIGEVNEDSPQARAAVRDGDDALEVVVVQRCQGVDRTPDWLTFDDPVLPVRDVPPSWAQARFLAKCTVNLPRRLTNACIVDRVIEGLEQNYFGGWRTSPYLKDQLTLVLDESRACELAGHLVRYDPQRGLLVTKLESLT